MNRGTFRIALVMAALIATVTVGLAATGSEFLISLAGTWRFDLDREDVGMSQQWFNRALREKIHLPGALQNQGFGEDITVDTKWTGEVGPDIWKRRPEYAKYRQPGNIKVPFFLQPEKHYVGAAWYQRDIEVPPSWGGKRLVLTFERVHWGTHLWLDGRLVGTNTSLATPHVYDLGAEVKPGKHTLTLRVDNRILVEVGDWSHSVSDHTQGNWNGAVGRIELAAGAPAWIEDLQVYPRWETKSITVKGRLGRATDAPSPGTIALSLWDRAGRKDALIETKAPVNWTSQSGEFEVVLEIPGQPLGWDEFNPRLYELRAVPGSEGDSREGKRVVFGLREIVSRDRGFFINGRPVFFRGTLECCIFPKTGYPPTDVESWKRIIRVCKEHGLNHIRFHSWCPPEAAFIAADELGFYYQVECGVWTQPGSGKSIDRWLYDESQSIVRAYGNHPSFMLLAHGNEPSGPKHEEYLAKWVQFWKRDGRFLVTSASAYPQLPENQYHVFYPSRGPHGWLGKDYRADVAKLEVPVIVHEMGQWCVYPNFDEVRKYTGPLKPKNFEIFRDSLAEHGMLNQWKDFLHASGKLQVLCYKEEVEAALRTPGIGGVQLLDLHDFPGQGTALVGVLDPFWEPKGYVTPKEFRRFCATTVPLARLLKRTWTTSETLACEIEVAHFGSVPLENAPTTWKLVDDSGRALAAGEFPSRTIPLSPSASLGRVEIPLAGLPAPSACKLIVKVGAFENDWNVWIYPEGTAGVPAGDVLVTSSLDDVALARLNAGGKVLLFATKLSGEHPKLGFEPIFWNRYMFNTQERRTLGLLCQPKHPALSLFPTKDFQDWQWRDIVTSARGMVLDDLPRDLRPIVQPIEDWNANRKLGLLFECRVGGGKLLVCSADLDTKLDQRPAARQLRASLLAYVAGKRFNPAVAVLVDAIRKMLERNPPSKMVRLGAKVISVDSEDTANGNVAANAIDGEAETFWHTRWQPANDPMPHFLVIDLGREITLNGLTYQPRQDMANGRAAKTEIFCGTDSQSWGEPVASVEWRNTGEVETTRFKQAARARYLKFVVTSEMNSNPFCAVGELDVLTDDK